MIISSPRYKWYAPKWARGSNQLNAIQDTIFLQITTGDFRDKGVFSVISVLGRTSRVRTSKSIARLYLCSLYSNCHLYERAQFPRFSRRAIIRICRFPNVPPSPPPVPLCPSLPEPSAEETVIQLSSTTTLTKIRTGTLRMYEGKENFICDFLVKNSVSSWTRLTWRLIAQF